MGLFNRFKQTPKDAPAADAASDNRSDTTDNGGDADSDGGRPRGLFAKLRDGLRKTTRLLNTDIRDLFKSEGRLIDDAFLDELLEVLVKTDMGVQPAQQTVDQVKSDFRGRVVQMDDVLATIKKKLTELMQQPDEPIRMAPSGPTVIMVAGVNGTRKDNEHRQAGADVHRARQEGGTGRGRYVSRRRC